jgi:hypothetical protein
MEIVKDSFSSKAKQTLLGFLSAVKRPLFWTVSLPCAFVFSFVMTMFTGGSFYLSLLSSPISAKMKVDTILDIAKSTFTQLRNSPDARLFLFMSILQGISIALLVLTIKINREFDVPSASKTGIASIIMLVGLGCPSCGTSILIPFLNLFVSSAAALASWLSIAFILIAIVLACWSIVRMSFVIGIYAD